MKRRLIALLLTLVTVLGMFPTTALAASSEEEALGEVGIFHNGQKVSYLSINGRVREQTYTYYNYKDESGSTRQIPAYCVNPNTAGVPQTVPAGTSIQYMADQKANDPKVFGIVASGYPHRSLEDLGLSSVDEGYYATKMALWCYLLDNWDINNLTVNPGADQAAAQRVLAAAKDIYQTGLYWNTIKAPRITATPDQDKPYPATVDGKEYLQQVYTVESETWVDGGVINISFTDPGSVPAGTRIVGKSGNDITGIFATESTGNGFSGEFTVLIPKDAVTEETGSIQLSLDAIVHEFAIFYAVCAEKGTYGELQNYMVDTDPRKPMKLDVLVNFSGDPSDPGNPGNPGNPGGPGDPGDPGDPGEPEPGSLRIVKRETGTLTPLDGAIFEVISPSGDTIGQLSTVSGEIVIPNVEPGNYTVIEKIPPKDHLLSAHPAQNITVREGETAEVTFDNDPYGELRVEKVSNTGEKLAGVHVQIKHIESGRTYSGFTEPSGAVQFTNLKPGAYEVREIAGIPGWKADTDTIKTVTVVTGETSTVTFTNKELPGLRIEKYDSSNNQVLSGVTFRIWRDGELLDDYRTGELGEILLTNLQPGTYLIQEIAADDGHIVDGTPQQIELHAGDGIKQVVFFNDRKPGIHLVKVDSANPSKGISNAKFVIEAVDGTFGPQEFTTGQDGSIDLSKLNPGAYVVTEIECPGYVIDEAQRIIELRGNDTAQFVFTNSIKPSIRIVKRSSDGSPLGGVHFRIARIEDGTRYLDRITNSQGEILISDLEPGVYSVRETDTVSDHIKDLREYRVELFPGKTSEICIENQKRPNLIVYKHDADTGEPIPDTVFWVKAADGHSVDEIKTDRTGKARLDNLLPGVYEISEKSVPAPWLMDAPAQLVTLYPNRDHTVYFENHKKPTLTVNKIDSVTGSPIKGAKFQVWYGSNHTTTGELNDLGTYFSDENGQFVLDLLRDGWYKVTELEPAAGFSIKEPATQEFYVKGGESKVLTFENVPLHAIVVEKYDSVTGEALPGCTFQLKYLGGTSGTGGAAIGQKVTGKNGTAMWTGLQPGTYVLEEVDPADGYNIIQSSETIFLADSGEQSVITVRFTNSPDGILLVRKVCSVNPSIPLQDAEFKITYADGTLIGDSNGVYRTDAHGEIRIPSLKPGKSVVVTETRAPDGFILDSQSQTVQIKEGRAVSLTFKNQPKGSLIVKKRDSQTNEVLPGAEFRITTAAGCEVGLDGVIGTATMTQNGIFTTDSNGEIRISNLAPGAYVLTEIKAPAGYVMDAPSTNVVIGPNGDTQTVIVTNTKKGSLIVEKYDSVTKQPLRGATFKITTASGELVPDNEGLTNSNGLYTTDANGQIVLSKLLPGTYVVAEEKAPDNYRKDPTPQTVVVNAADTQTLRFYDDPLCTLTILKRDAVTKKPLARAEFFVRDSEGRAVGPNNGRYITGTDGTATITGLEPNVTIVVSETKAPTGYILDETPQNIVVRTGVANSLIFDDQPGTTLIIRKFIEGTENEPLSGVAFKVIDGSGAAVGPDDGVYYTDHAGEIVLSGIEPGTTVTAREIKTVDGFVLDGTPQTILIKGGEVQQLTFWNKRDCSLTILKQSTSKEPLTGAVFHVTDEDGAAIGTNNGRYTTDRNGLITITGLQPGQVLVVTEEKAPSGYVKDPTPKTIKIKKDVANSLIFENAKTGSLVINKRSSVDKKTPLEGVTFKITTTNGSFLPDEDGKISSNGLYYTDENGQIVLNSVVGTLVVTEVATIDGYTIHEANRTQTVEVTTDDTQTLYFYNDPLCSLTLKKIDAITGKPVPNTEFTLKDGNGNIIGRYTTGSDGTVTVTGLIPNSTVVVVETRVPPNYVLDPTPRTIIVRNGTGNSVTTGGSGTIGGGSGSGGNGNDLTVENVPKVTLTIEKYLETESGDKPLKGVTFLITDQTGAMVGSSNGEFTSDENGRIVIPNLEPGTTVTAKEIRVPDGVVLDSSPRSILIKAGEQGQTLRVVNKQAGTLVIRKLDKVTGEPLSGVEFELTYAEGGYVDDANGHLSSKGLYTTGANGEIRISGITGTIVIKETKCLPGYSMDPATQTQTITVNPADTQTITVYNMPAGGAEIIKVDAGDTSKRLANATFEIRRMDGGLVDTVTTGADGRVQLDLDAGNYYAVETRAAEGYVLDDAPTYFTVEDGKSTAVTITNKAVAGVEIIKVDEADRTRRLANVTFEIRRRDDALVDTVTTGADGRVQFDLDAGDYYALEVEAAEGYKLDNTPHYFTVEDGKPTSITITNKAFSGILLHKTDSTTGKGIYGVTFLLYDSSNKPIGQYTTDNNGYIYIEDLTASGKYFLKELENKGYIVDTQMKTVYVTAGETTLVEWQNTPITGQIQLSKTSAEYNTMNGWPAGTPIPNTEFEIYDYRTNNLVDTVRTDKNGLASSRPLPLGRYKVVESKAANFYGLDKTPMEVEIEYAGQIVKAAMTNKSLYTNVSITKRGYGEVVPGQSIRYDFSGIANNSTTALTSFYWRDTLPTRAVRLDKIVTGTYNVPGNYKIVYKTNLSSEYRTLADNVSTQQNKVIIASPAALGLASNECVTEFMCVFGVVPSNFRQVEAPAVYCGVLSGLTGGTQFVNQADVGGVYNGQWIMATDRWVTTIYKPATPLPRTGY